MNDFSGYTIPEFFYFLLSHKQNLFGDMGITGYTYGIDENSLYVGVVPFLLFCFFSLRNAKQVKKYLVLVILLICMVFLMLGNRISPSLYSLLKTLPFFSSFRVAQRFRFDFIIPFALLAGMGLDRLLSLKEVKQYKTPIFIGIFLFVFIDLMIFNQRNFLSKTLILKNITKDNPLQFKQVASFSNVIEYYPNSIPRNFEYTKIFEPWSAEYKALRNNVGVINCSYTLTGTVAALPFSDLRYKGEWYTQRNSRIISLTKWTPQEISFSLTKNNPQEGEDILVLNQNHFPGWYVKRGDILTEAENTNGLISTSIHNEKNIQFIYMPYRVLWNGFFTILHISK
jgi:hypothetical protein